MIDGIVVGALAGKARTCRELSEAEQEAVLEWSNEVVQHAVDRARERGWDTDFLDTALLGSVDHAWSASGPPV